jgi:hypothetical protein
LRSEAAPYNAGTEIDHGKIRGAICKPLKDNGEHEAAEPKCKRQRQSHPTKTLKIAGIYLRTSALPCCLYFQKPGMRVTSGKRVRRTLGKNFEGIGWIMRVFITT